MPFKDKDKQKEFQRNWCRKRYHEDKEYREKIKERSSKYIKTEKGKKNNRIKSWKEQGIIFSDYDLLYDIFINTKYCDLCKVELTEDIRKKTTRCLDHDHSITDCENIRNILCLSCNIKRG